MSFFSLGPRTGCCGRVCFTFPPPSLEVDLARAGDQQGGMDCTPYAKGSECTAVGCAGQAERPCTTRGKPSKLDRGLTSWQCHNSAVELNTTCVYTYYIILYFIVLYYILFYFIVLYYIILYFIVLYYIIFYCTVLYYIFFIILYHIVLFYILLRHIRSVLFIVLADYHTCVYIYILLQTYLAETPVSSLAAEECERLRLATYCGSERGSVASCRLPHT